MSPSWTSMRPSTSRRSTLPEGVKPIIRGRDFTVCSIVAPTSVHRRAAAPLPPPPPRPSSEAAPAEGAAPAAGAAAACRRRRAGCRRQGRARRRAGQEVRRSGRPRRGERVMVRHAASYRGAGQSRRAICAQPAQCRLHRRRRNSRRITASGPGAPSSTACCRKARWRAARPICSSPRPT